MSMLDLLPNPYRFVSAICADGRDAVIGAYMSLLESINNAYKLPEPEQYAASGLIYTLNLARDQYANDDAIGCYDLMRDEGFSAIPEIMWEVLGAPPKTEVYLRFVENRIDGWTKPYKVEMD